MSVNKKEYPRRLLLFRSGGFMELPSKKPLLRDWFIIRFTTLPYPTEPNLIPSTLRKTIPLPDNTFESIYCYHVSEHLTIEENDFLYKELLRILKPGGILRLSTPDLELMAADYLAQLRQYLADGSPSNYIKYQWSVTGLLDQMVRRKSGGRMADDYLASKFDPDHEKYLHGDTLHYIFDPTWATEVDTGWKKTYTDGRPASTWFWLKKMLFAAWRKLLLGNAEFRLKRWQERETWVYDQVSMRKLLENAGAKHVKLLDYKTSEIPDWSNYDFDQSIHGDYAFEPSVFIEARKP